MATGWPGAVDGFPRPDENSNTDDPGEELDVILDHHSDAIEKLEEYVGFQPINAQTGTSYNLVASDTLKLVTLTNSSPITLGVPSGVFTAGQRIDVVVLGTGMATVVPGTGTPTVEAEDGMSLVTRAQRSVISIYALSSSSFLVVGSLAAL
jgi:hypothetical protein